MTDPSDPRNASPPGAVEGEPVDYADGETPRAEEQAPPAEGSPSAGERIVTAGEPVDPADGSTSAASPGGLAEALEAVTRERDTYLDHLRRERAEFENYRRRSTRERAEALDRGAENLISQLLGILDNFGYVLEAAKDHDDAVAKGVRMVHTELLEVLERAGLEEVPGVGAPFDPNWHDAVMQVEGDTTEQGEPIVAQVLRAGFRFKGRVLRPASVAVTQ